MDLIRPLTDTTKCAYKFGVGTSSLKTYLRNFFTPPIKIDGETSNFSELPLTRRQSEARNFETAQHIDKQKPDVSSTTNALKMVPVPNLGASPHGVLMQPREKIDKL